MFRSIIITLTIFILSGGIIAQEGVNFEYNSYENSLDKAQAEGKGLMFYFHSEYCSECVELDSIFQSTLLSSNLNTNFISVKVDIDEPLGQRLFRNYNIRFLPSLLFLDKNHKVIFVISDDFNEINILNHANMVVDKTMLPTEFKIAFNNKEKIENYEKVDSLFDFVVLNNLVLEKKNPTHLYNQSYMHKTLNDGQANTHAMDYLKSQMDWTSDKNMQFIIDFTDDTRTFPFNYLLANKKIFQEKFGFQVIDDFITDLVNKRLYNLQPPPKFEESVDLMQILSPEYSHKRTYEYLIDMRLKMNKVVEYLYLERKYIKKFASKDHERMMKMCNIYLEKISDNSNADYYIATATTATKIFPNNIDYQNTLTKLYLKKKDKTGALNSFAKSYSIAIEEGLPTESLLEQLLEITNMH